VDPDTGLNVLGTKVIKEGPCSFFLQPGEVLEGGIKDLIILGDDEAVLLKANEAYYDKKPGDRWMIYGPQNFLPPTQVEVLEKRQKISLHLNEGVYVRDTKTGAVKVMIGKTYMLEAHEELWEMDLPETVENLLRK